MKAFIFCIPPFIRKISRGLLIITFMLVATGYAHAQSSFDYQDNIPGFNPFQQTNIGLPKSGPGSLNYYGSGDVNNDGVVNYKDVQAIENGVINDRGMVTGDTNRINNKDTLKLYLDGKLSYLPMNLNQIDSITGANKDNISLRYLARMNWIKKFLKIDKTDTIRGKTNVFDCKDFSNEDEINGSGMQNFTNFVDVDGIDSTKYVTRYGAKNNRFNGAPIYTVLTYVNPGALPPGIATDKDSHKINAFFVGSKNPAVKANPKKFNQWYFFEPQTNMTVVPGDWDMNANKPVIIERWLYAPNLLGQWGFQDNQLVEFDLTNGKPTIPSGGVNSYLILENPEQMDPQVETSKTLDTIVANYSSDPTTQAKIIADSLGKVTATANTQLYTDKIKLLSWQTDTTSTSSHPKIEYNYKQNYQAEVEIGMQPPKSQVKEFYMKIRDVEPPVINAPDSVKTDSLKENPIDVVKSHVTATDNSGLPVTLTYAADNADAKTDKNYYTHIPVIVTGTDWVGNATKDTVEAIVKESAEGVNYIDAHPDFNVVPVYFTDGRINLRTTAGKYGQLTQKVYNLSGQIIVLRKTEIYPGTVQNYVLNNTNMSPGMYLVTSELSTLGGKKETETNKIIVR